MNHLQPPPARFPFSRYRYSCIEPGTITAKDPGTFLKTKYCFKTNLPEKKEEQNLTSIIENISYIVYIFCPSASAKDF